MWQLAIQESIRGKRRRRRLNVFFHIVNHRDAVKPLYSQFLDKNNTRLKLRENSRNTGTDTGYRYREEGTTSPSNYGTSTAVVLLRKVPVQVVPGTVFFKPA